mgnify:CR=1 FL=1
MFPFSKVHSIETYLDQSGLAEVSKTGPSCIRPHLQGWQSERYTSPSKEAGLAIYLACLAKVANLYYMILTAFKRYWPNTVANFISGTQETFIYIKRQKLAPVHFELEYM